MNYESMAALWLTPEEPAVAVRAPVKLPPIRRRHESFLHPSVRAGTCGCLRETAPIAFRMVRLAQPRSLRRRIGVLPPNRNQLALAQCAFASLCTHTVRRLAGLIFRHRAQDLDGFPRVFVAGKTTLDQADALPHLEFM